MTASLQTQENALVAKYERITPHAQKIFNSWLKSNKKGGLQGLRGRLTQASKNSRSSNSSGANTKTTIHVAGIPRNKLKVKVSPGVARALYAILNPFQHHCRPGPVDGTERNTHWYPSRQVFPIYGHDSEGADTERDGSFFISVRPTMGNAQNIDQYNISIWNALYPVTDPSISTRDAANWASDVDGKDPRVDDNVGLLLNQNLSLNAFSTTGLTISIPFGAPTDMVWTSNKGGLARLRYSTISGFSRFYFPPGSFNISLVITGTGFTPGTAGLTLAPAFADFTLNNSTASTKITAKGRMVILQSDSDSGINYVDISVAAGTSVIAATLDISPGIYPIPTNDGEVSAIQVGQMSAWFKFTAPRTYVGGTIYSALTGQDGEKIFVKNDSPPSPGSFLEPENMGRLQDVYRGNVTDGTVVWYQHSDQVQRDFAIPSEQATIDFPAICISGRATVIDGANATDAGYKGQIGELWVATNYYLDTSNIVWGTEAPIVSEHEYQAAWSYARKLPHALPNKSHFKMFQQVMRELGHDAKGFTNGLLDFARGTANLVKENMAMLPMFL